MLGGVAMRERACPACGGKVRGRSARWCGSCGAPLEPFVDNDAGARLSSPHWVRLVLAGAVATAVAVAVVVSGGGLVERASPTTAVDDPVVAGPNEDALDDLPRGEPPASPVATDPTCSEGPELGCFLWTIEEADRATPPARRTCTALGGAPQPGASGHPGASDRSVAAYDLRDGIEVWSAPGARRCRTARSCRWSMTSCCTTTRRRWWPATSSRARSGGATPSS